MAVENPTNATTSIHGGFSITTLTALLPSFTGFRGLLTLFLMGCVFEMCRRFAPHAWEALVDSFWVTIEFDEDDRSYRECLLAIAMSPLPGADHVLSP